MEIILQLSNMYPNKTTTTELFPELLQIWFETHVTKTLKRTYLFILRKTLILHRQEWAYPSQNSLAVPSRTSSFESMFHVPHEQNPYFTGRDELLEIIIKFKTSNSKDTNIELHSSDLVGLAKHKLP